MSAHISNKHSKSMMQNGSSQCVNEFDGEGGYWYMHTIKILSNQDEKSILMTTKIGHFQLITSLQVSRV